MKRITLYLIFGLLATYAHADLVSTVVNSIIVEEQRKESVPLKFEFYGKVGANIMSADWNKYNFRGKPQSDLTGKSKFGVDFTLGFMSRFRPSNPSNFYWGAELSLTQVGGGYDEFTLERWRLETYPACSFADWGVVLSPAIGWKKGVTDKISIDMHFNPGIFYKFNLREVDFTWSSTSNNVTESYQLTNNIDDSRIRVSLKGGVGVWFNKVNIDFSYRYLTLFEDYYVNYSNFIISLGYSF